MNSEIASDVACWYAIHTKPKQEGRAVENLKCWGVETFSPKIRVRRFNQFTGAPTHLINHLYPSYIFARFRATSLLHKIHFTRGVDRVVSFGGVPLPVDERIIDIINAQLDDDGFVRIGEKLKYGDTVMVEQGPFRYFVGMFESDMNESERVRLLLTTISYQARVEVDREFVKKLW